MLNRILFSKFFSGMNERDKKPKLSRKSIGRVGEELQNFNYVNVDCIRSMDISYTFFLHYIAFLEIF